MAVKTITIDMEAYGILARRKREGDSFSDVIKAHFGPQPTKKRFMEIMKRVRFSPDMLGAVDEVIRSRKDSPARAVKL